MPIAIPTLGQVSYEPITLARTTTSGPGVAQIERWPEINGLTAKQGVPIRINGGYADEATFGAADILLGFSLEPGHNLTSSGVAQAGVSEATARNQASSLTIPVGAWVRDGKLGVLIANGESIFSAALKTGQVFTQALIIAGTYYQLVKDATTGFWFIDNTATGGNAAVAQLIGVDPSAPNTVAGGSRVLFTLKPAQAYFNT